MFDSVKSIYVCHSDLRTGIDRSVVSNHSNSGSTDLMFQKVHQNFSLDSERMFFD